MKFFKSFVVIGLSISLFINLSLMSKINHLENHILSLSSTQDHVMSMVNSQTGNIRNTLNEIKKEQSWLGYVNTDVTVSDPQSEEAQVAFEWQIKEITEQAQVHLHYRLEGQSEFSSLPAEEISKGVFSAKVSVPITLEPEWHIMSRDERGSGSGPKETHNTEEFYEDVGTESQIHYYITLTEDGTSISSDRNAINMAHFGTRYYGLLQVISSIDNRDRVFISSTQMFPGQEGITVERMYLRRYSNGILSEEAELQPPDRPDYERAGEVRVHRHLTLENVIEEELYDRYVIHVIYSDGAEFEKGFFIR